MGHSLLGTPPKVCAQEDDRNAVKEGAKLDTSMNGRFLFFPIIFYRPETRFGFGLGESYYFTMKEDGITRPSQIVASQVFTQNKQLIFNVVGDFYLTQNKYHFATDLIFRKFPNRFNGIGNDTPDDPEQYSANRYETKLLAERRFGKHFFAGILQHYRYFDLTDTDDDGALQYGNITGSGQPHHSSGVGVTFNYDNRDQVFFPVKGGINQFKYIHYSQLLGSTYDFNYYELDLRRYIKTYKTHVLALQFRSEFIFGKAPFHMLAQLGGSNELRGYFRGRYRDNHLLMLQAEYRFKIWWRFNGAVFGGIGDVSDKINHFQLLEAKPSYGAGLRFMLFKEKRINLRFDFGLGRNTHGFYLEISEAF